MSYDLKHAKPLSPDPISSEFVPQSYLTCGLDTASHFFDVQTAYLSGNVFSEVFIPTPVPAHVRLPEYYTAEPSRPPTPNFADYPIRVDGITIYDPKNNPRFPMLTKRFITTILFQTKEKKQNLKTPNFKLRIKIRSQIQIPRPESLSSISRFKYRIQTNSSYI